MGVDIQIRRDTAANWTSANPTLASGEIGLETDTGKWKWGDGSTAWSSLAYYRQYTDAEVTKLAGIETSADVTDATNVASSGAVMADGSGNDITGDLVFDEKADHSSTPSAGHGYLWTKNTTPSTLIFTDDAGTDTTLGSGGTTDHGALTGLTDDDHTQYLLVAGSRAMTGSLDMGTQAITNVGNVDGRDVSADGTKLDGIESGADVTDATNVAAAGAVMADGTGNDIAGDLVFTEKADHSETPTATKGQLWVRNDTPNVLVFTDDAGTDTVLGAGGGGLNDVVDDTTPQLGGQLDVNGNALGDGTNELLSFVEDASAVNHVEIENQATGSGPIIRATGDDTNVDLELQTKGTGEVNVQGNLGVVGAITVSSTVDGVDIAARDHDSVTLAGTPDYITLAGQVLTRNLIDLTTDVTGDLPVAEGGTGASDAATARTNLGVDAAGTDNSTDVTLAGTPDYITISGQVITRNQIDLTSDVTGDLPLANVAQMNPGKVWGRAFLSGVGDATEVSGNPLLAIAWEAVLANRILATDNTTGGVFELLVPANSVVGRGTTGDITTATLAAGQIPYNNLAGGGLGAANFDTALKENLLLSKSITVESPTASEDITMFYTDVALTITAIEGVIIGSTSVDVNIYHNTSRSAAGNAVCAADRTVSSTTTGDNLTLGGDVTVPAASFVWLESSALSGTPTELHLTLFYNED